MTTDAPARWEDLRPFAGTIAGDEQVVVIAMKGGAKSTLVASLTLDVPSIVAIDDKARMTLPSAVIYDLPPYARDTAADFDGAVRQSITWAAEREHRPLDRLLGRPRPAHTNRVILRPDPLDADAPEPHDHIFRQFYLHRPDTILWIDEITATGATPHSIQPSLRAISARGRTRGQGMWSCSQAAYGLIPGVLLRNAGYVIVGPIPPKDAKEMERDGWQWATLAASLPTHTGRFIIWRQGELEPYRLYVPIPDRLHSWEAP